MSPDWTAIRVLGLLEARYPAPEWALVSNLRAYTGYRHPGRESYMDAFAMGCWPSKGYTRVAFEIKVTRSDWLAELRDPGKRANGMRLSNEFWFVAPTKVIKPDEVPEGCGWMEANTGGLRIRKAAPHRKTKPMPVDFVASLLRTITGPNRLGIHQAKAFRYAGRDLTADQFLEATATDVEHRVEARTRSRLRAAVRETPEYELGAAVRAAMGGHSWSRPTVADFNLWRETMTLGGLNGEASSAKTLVQRLRYALESAETLERKLNGSPV